MGRQSRRRRWYGLSRKRRGDPATTIKEKMMRFPFTPFTTFASALAAALSLVAQCAEGQELDPVSFRPRTICCPPPPSCLPAMPQTPGTPPTTPPTVPPTTPPAVEPTLSPEQASATGG